MEHIGYTTTLIYDDCGELEGECSEIKNELTAYTDIEYIKRMKSLQWIDFTELHYNISPRTGRPDTLNAIQKRLKRVYFGEVRKFGSLESYYYFCERNIIDNLKPEDLVVVSRLKDGGVEIIYPIPTKKSRNGKLVPTDGIEVLSDNDIENLTSISPLHPNKSFMSYVMEGSKKLVDEHQDIVQSIADDKDVLSK